MIKIILNTWSKWSHLVLYDALAVLKSFHFICILPFSSYWNGIVICLESSRITEALMFCFILGFRVSWKANFPPLLQIWKVVQTPWITVKILSMDIRTTPSQTTTSKLQIYPQLQIRFLKTIWGKILPDKSPMN